MFAQPSSTSFSAPTLPPHTPPCKQRKKKSAENAAVPVVLTLVHNDRVVRLHALPPPPPPRRERSRNAPSLFGCSIRFGPLSSSPGARLKMGIFPMTTRFSQGDSSPCSARNVCGKDTAFPRTSKGFQPGRQLGEVTRTRPKSKLPPKMGATPKRGPGSCSTSHLTKALRLSFARRVTLPKSVLCYSEYTRNRMENMPGAGLLPLPPGPLLAGAASEATCPSRVLAPHAPNGGGPGEQARTCPGLPWPGQ